MPKKPEAPLLVLLDMHAILHRGYHALQGFATSDGRPTGALYGLYLMLISLIKELDPEYMVGCFDLPEPTKRHEMFADYKAGRAETDDALVAQIKESRKVLDAFGVTHFEATGFEADDLLGTIVKKLDQPLAAKEVAIIIASGDHDTLQLVRAKEVQVYAMRRGVKDTVLYDESGVKKKFGFGPEFLPDYKGLRGDPSDNIPGLKGVGEKTASDLIDKYGHLEEILKKAESDPEGMKADGVRKGVVKRLRDDSETARFSKELAVIRTDAPVELELGQTKWRDNLNQEELLQLTDELQFRSVKERLSEVFGVALGDDENKTATLFDDAKSLRESIETAEDKKLLEEAKLMLWLLNSDQTNPKASDIERYSNSADIKTAHKKLCSEISEDDLDKVFKKIEKPLLPVVSKMSETGICLDVEFLSKLKADYTAQLEGIERDIYELAGDEFNINSPQQLQEVLFNNDQLGLPKSGIKKTSTGNFSTAESELKKLEDKHEIIPLILSYRELAKLVNTYIKALPKLVDEDSRLRANFIQWGTTTGRMSSRNPNLQNIPIRSELGRPIRKAFIAGKGKSLIAIDYSQIELRIAAWLSGDEVLKKVFSTGKDIHASVAANMFGLENETEVSKAQRSAAKVINYGILYGMGANALRDNLNTDEVDEVTRAQATQYLEQYFETYPKLAAYLEGTKRFAKKHGYTETYFGRRRHFKTIKSKLPYLRAQAERMAINAPIQGTQADIIKLAMVKVDDWIEKHGDEVALLLQVHDELVFEAPQDKVKEVAKQLVKIMESVLSLEETGGVEIIADASIGPNWGDLKVLK